MERSTKYIGAAVLGLGLGLVGLLKAPDYFQQRARAQQFYSVFPTPEALNKSNQQPDRVLVEDSKTSLKPLYTVGATDCTVAIYFHPPFVSMSHRGVKDELPNYSNSYLEVIAEQIADDVTEKGLKIEGQAIIVGGLQDLADRVIVKLKSRGISVIDTYIDGTLPNDLNGIEKNICAYPGGRVIIQEIKNGKKRYIGLPTVGLIIKN